MLHQHILPLDGIEISPTPAMFDTVVEIESGRYFQTPHGRPKTAAEPCRCVAAIIVTVTVDGWMHLC